MRSAFFVPSPKITALRALNYTPEVETFRAKSNRRSCERFGDLLANLGLGYRSVFKRIDCQPSYGVELVSQSDMFATEPVGRFIRRDCIPNPAAHEINRWQILVAGVGTLGENELYGRSIIADQRLVGRYVGNDAMVMTFKSPGSPKSLYAYAFLCTKVGIRCVRAASYGTKLLALRPEMLSDLPIPLASDVEVNRVAGLVRTTVLKRDEYARSIRQARELIEMLPEVQCAREINNESRARCLILRAKSFPTLSAWNYASVGGVLEYLRSQWKSRLADVVPRDRISYGARFARIPCTPPFGIDFWSQRDIFLIRPVPRRIQKPRLPNYLLSLPKETILVSGRGQLQEGNLFGRVELALFGASACVVSGDAIPLIPVPEYSDLLYTFFSTTLGLQLLRSCAIGTSIPAMHLGLLGQLPFPDINAATLSQIRGHLKNAAEARIAATTAETEAIRIIEEEVLPEWLA